MNEFPELVCAGGDWMFIIFVVFAIVGQVIDAKRKRKRKQAQRTTGSRPRPTMQAVPREATAAPQEELNAFLRELGLQQEKIAPAPPPPRPKLQPQPEPAVAPVRTPPVSLPKKTVIKPAVKPQIRDEIRHQEPVPSRQMEDNLIPHSCSQILKIPTIKMPSIQLGPSRGQRTTSQFDLNLKDRNELRRAILNREILGKPKAMESFQ